MLSYRATHGQIKTGLYFSFTCVIEASYSYLLLLDLHSEIFQLSTTYEAIAYIDFYVTRIL